MGGDVVAVAVVAVRWSRGRVCVCVEIALWIGGGGDCGAWVALEGEIEEVVR